MCMVMPLGNTEDVVLDGFDMELAPGSHHLIAYLTDAAVTAPNTYPCSPFTGVVVGTDVPVAFANAENVSFSFPKGVAIEIPANSNIKIEAHYINASSTALQGRGQVHFHAVPKASAPPYQDANFLLATTTKISIPPNSSYSTGPQGLGESRVAHALARGRLRRHQRPHLPVRLDQHDGPDDHVRRERARRDVRGRRLLLLSKGLMGCIGPTCRVRQ